MPDSPTSTSREKAGLALSLALLTAAIWCYPESPWQRLGNCTADLLYASLIILSGPLLCTLAIRLWRDSLGSRAH